MPDTLTTQILIERVKAGDSTALNDLCARYYDRVLQAIRFRMGAKLRRKAGSSDMVQEVLLGAFGRIKSGDFGTEGKLMRYLNVLVANRLRDEARRQRAKRRNADLEIALDGRSPGDELPLIDIEDSRALTPSRVLARREELELMERAMDRLEPEQRKLVVAVELEGHSYAELAQEGRFGTTPDAVRMRANRARARLATVYRELAGGV